MNIDISQDYGNICIIVAPTTAQCSQGSLVFLSRIPIYLPGSESLEWMPQIANVTVGKLWPPSQTNGKACSRARGVVNALYCAGILARPATHYSRESGIRESFINRHLDLGRIVSLGISGLIMLRTENVSVLFHGVKHVFRHRHDDANRAEQP